MADIVSDFLDRLQNLAPDIPHQTRQILEAQIRQQWGGTEPYVAKRPAIVHAIRLGEALRARKPLAQCVLEEGISRRSGYRILARR